MSSRRKGMEQAAKVQPPGRFGEGGVILDPRRVEPATPIRMGESIETLEALLATVTAQEWHDGNAKHSVLYGIKMCLHALKQKQPNVTEE